MKKLFLIIPLFFLSCSTKNQVVNSYTLGNATVKAKKSEKSVCIDIDSESILKTGKIYWQKGYEKNPYLYSQWIDDFDSLIKKSVYNALFYSFKGVYFDNNCDINLKLFITDAVHVVTEKDSYVLLDIKAYANGKAKDFNYKIPCKKNAKSAVWAFNKAVKRFEEDLVKWLRKRG